jgi:hypothetical protein
LARRGALPPWSAEAFADALIEDPKELERRAREFRLHINEARERASLREASGEELQLELEEQGRLAALAATDDGRGSGALQLLQDAVALLLVSHEAGGRP